MGFPWGGEESPELVGEECQGAVAAETEKLPRSESHAGPLHLKQASTRV